MSGLRRAPVVLMHHGFSATRRHDDPDNLLVPLPALRRQLQLLRDRGWHPLDLDGYLAANRGRQAFLFTADDGYQSFADVAYPLLRAFGVPSVLFVCPALVGGRSVWMPGLPDEPLCDADTLRALRRGGVEIGLHGMDHSRMVGMGPEELRRQVVDAGEQLADVVGVRPRAFAYPYGAFDDVARRTVEAAGFAVGFSVHRDEGRHAVSRVDVNAADSLATFRVKLLPGYRRLWRLAERTAWVRAAARRLLGGAGA